MGIGAHQVTARLRPRVGAKFLLGIGVLVLAVLAVAGVGLFGLSRMAQRTNLLYTDGLAASQHSADVTAATDAVHETALYQVAVDDPTLNAQLRDELDQLLLPRAQETIDVLRADYADEPARQGTVDQIEAGLRQYLQLRQTGAYDVRPGRPAASAARAALASRTDQLLGPIVDDAERLRASEARDNVQIKTDSENTYRSTRQLLAVSVAALLLLALGVVIALIRSMVPRIRLYSRFAADIAAGRPTRALNPRGHDELTDLGNALNDLVQSREQARAAEQAQRELISLAEQAQAEFVDTLQLTRSEDEAQELLQRHLERSLPGSTVTVLRCTSIDDRLQAATAMAPTSGLAARLAGAGARSCVAVRFGRTHREDTGRLPLVGCTLCQDGDRPSHCEPLVVGGDVVGSVLVTGPAGVAGTNDIQIKNTLGQAGPVLATLRTLALAEFRASNDALTGLPNKKATEDTLKRMVAQAERSVTPLTAIMLDLDHFKAINDSYGHAQGDEVLAAVGIVIQASIRGSDFAGRFGGEEFIVLLPDTPVDSAAQVAEKIRRNISSIGVPGVDRPITASLGIAGLLENAGTAAGLLREADRAQYAAKAAGRNRCVTAAPGVAETPPERATL
jgi:diguanylate cyclase (GGDEF)-like protein